MEHCYEAAGSGMEGSRWRNHGPSGLAERETDQVGHCQSILDVGSHKQSHGRDHKLRVWQLRAQDYARLNRDLPVDGSARGEGQQPWLLHSLPVHALNFCAFATRLDPDARDVQEPDGYRPIMIAAPNGVDPGGVDIFQLPSERRISTLASDNGANTGMVMAVSLYASATTGRLNLIRGFEDGHIRISARKEVSKSWEWEHLVTSKAHSQPVLALDIIPGVDCFVSSSADACIARFAIPSTAKAGVTQPERVVNTKHAGQQDVKVRSDGRIFATAGWDKSVRVYSAKTLKELAVLKWHQEGCYSIAFAQIVASVDSSHPTHGALTKGDTMDLIRSERSRKAQVAHWLAAGAKDGKISLWDIY